jgi:hypothetical protein
VVAVVEIKVVHQVVAVMVEPVAEVMVEKTDLCRIEMEQLILVAVAVETLVVKIFQQQVQVVMEVQE